MDFTLGILTRLLALGSTLSDSPACQQCLSLKTSLKLENTTILGVSYLPSQSKIKTLGTCQTTAGTSLPLCRVQFHTRTSEKSGINAEAWLPDEWYGRFMAVGNAGLNGCIGYADLDYGSSLHFATVGSNNGHDGDTALPFLNNSEVLADFSHRSIHVEAVIGKQIVEAYYGRPHDTAIYFGCSTGGRQGTQNALKYPDDFDGIIAGAPAIDFNHLVHWSGMLSRHVGAPHGSSSPSFIPLDWWKFIAEEVLRQCDTIDGIADGIITDPDACDFRPEELLCLPESTSKKPCLTQPQVDALRKIYSPLNGPDGSEWYPRYAPGSEGSPLIPFTFSGHFTPYTEEWMKYVVLNSSSFDASTYGLPSGVLMSSVDGSEISTFSGDLSPFFTRGGKFLAFHGTADPIISPGISKRYYNLVSRTLSLDSTSLDAFYRLFLIPGMDHCRGGVGASHIGQGPGYVNASSHHVVLAMVDWVERGLAPDEIIGTAADGVTTRAHCRYPKRSVWDGTEFVCV